MKTWTEGRIALLGNVPTRDCLAVGTPADVAKAVTDMLGALQDHSRLIVSGGGGMPPGVPSENIRALLDTVGRLTA
jgi:uroporphyrinogen decarboxylase